MRGMLAHLLPAADELRFIPAWAGNAARADRFHGLVSVHPRMRGERSSRSGPGVASHGSSLHARGTPLDGQPRFALTRFIPAYAGNARRPADAIADHPVHPRMRGERLSVAVRLNSSSGSSPHARGTRSRVPLAPFPVSVHPRMRGERPAEDSSGHGACGSSPHARGTRNPRHSRRLDYRFIPACAGNAYPQCARRRPAAVHPRMRGERLNSIRDIGYNLGSSPHARGTPEHGQHACQDERFIPACAGNAWWRMTTAVWPSVHPRMRGERMQHPFFLWWCFGSSPHARGTPRSAPHQSHQ